jgi:hypothetical protein
MSIERSLSPAQTESPDPVRDRQPEARPRDPAPREAVDDFQRLLQAKREQRAPREPQPARAQADDGRQPLQQAARHPGDELAAQRREDEAIAGRPRVAEREHGQDDDPLRRHDDASTSPSQAQQIDAAALYQAQAAMRDGLPAPAAPAPINPHAFADMVERHLKQLAADRGAADGGDGHVLLRMADATLPGTDLLLSRTEQGWMLRAEVRSRGSYDAIRQAAPELARRFAERNLGVLEVDPHFHG